MPYLEIDLPATTVESSISIALGTATTISASTMTVIARNDDGTLRSSEGGSGTVSVQGIGSIVFTTSPPGNKTANLNFSSGKATLSFRGKDAGDVEFSASVSSTYRDGGASVTVVANSKLGGTTRPGGVGLPSAGSSGGTTLARGTSKIFNQTVYRVILWDMTSTKARNTIRAIIHDAKNVGVSSYLNEGGEAFFTLPYNHPQISECVPLERHYRIDRFDEEDGRYVTVGQGILEDYEATPDETVFYGLDYMMVLSKTITTPTTTATVTYNNQTFGNIFIDQMTQAVNQTDSRLKFITFKQNGFNHTASNPLIINSSATTYDIFTGGESRGSFLTNLANIVMEGTTTKVVFGNPLESETELYNTFFCDMNWASAKNNDLVLEYGSNVKSFSYSPNYRQLLTRALVVATSVYNAISPTKIWSSVATSTAAPTATYGVIEAAFIEQDLASQAAVDAKAKYRLYQSSPEKIKNISLAVTDGSIIPFKRYKLGDDIKVRINRGNVNIDTYLTLRGQRYVGSTDGTEQLWFDFFPRDTMSDSNVADGNKKKKKPIAVPPTPEYRKPKKPREESGVNN